MTDAKIYLLGELINAYGYELYRVSMLIFFFLSILFVIMLTGMAIEEKETNNIELYDTAFGLSDADLDPDKTEIMEAEYSSTDTPFNSN